MSAQQPSKFNVYTHVYSLVIVSLRSSLSLLPVNEWRLWVMVPFSVNPFLIARLLARAPCLDEEVGRKAHRSKNCQSKTCLTNLPSRSPSQSHKPACVFCHADLSSGSPGHVFPSALENSG